MAAGHIDSPLIVYEFMKYGFELSYSSAHAELPKIDAMLLPGNPLPWPDVRPVPQRTGSTKTLDHCRHRSSRLHSVTRTVPFKASLRLTDETGDFPYPLGLHRKQGPGP